MDVRPATVHDARAIATVHVRSWRSAYTGLLPDGYLESLSVDRGASMWEEIVRGDEARDLRQDVPARVDRARVTPAAGR